MAIPLNQTKNVILILVKKYRSKQITLSNMIIEPTSKFLDNFQQTKTKDDDIILYLIVPEQNVDNIIKPWQGSSVG